MKSLKAMKLRLGGELWDGDHRWRSLTVFVDASSVQLLDQRRHLVPLTLGPTAVQLRIQAELGEGDPGCHRRSVPVVTALSGHDGSDCGLQHRSTLSEEGVRVRVWARVCNLFHKRSLFVCFGISGRGVHGSCRKNIRLGVSYWAIYHVFFQKSH